MLNEHNTFRAKYGESFAFALQSTISIDLLSVICSGASPLKWNPTLAIYAKNYASQCKFAHS